ncbi:hypothetical protein BH23PLA1_BH23PLA1_05320 [soil metagenome]
MSEPKDPLEWSTVADSNKPALTPRTSGMAIASLVLGLMSLLICLTGLPAVILGALGLGKISGSRGAVSGKGMAITGIVTGTIGTLVMPVLLLLPAVQAAREAARRSQCTNNLKQISIALMNYESVNGCFPPGFSPDEQGTPRTSWRVSILPFLEQQAVFAAYNFDVAWDHSSNNTAINARISTYVCPSEPTRAGEELHTHYQMITGPGTMFDPARRAVTSFGDITDGSSNTLFIVESRQSVHWASPQDIVIDTTNPAGTPSPAPGSSHPGGYNAAMVDGSIRFLKDSVAPDVLRAMMSIRGGEILPMGEL